MDTISYYTDKRRKRVKLIFNPKSGSTNESPVQLMDIIGMLQAWKLTPEVFLIEPDCDLQKMAVEALEHGIHLFVVCGGDGTVSAVAKVIAGLPATLGIIPTGTQNNIAHSLEIPADLSEAISILRMGRRTKIDTGTVTCNGVQTRFLEICSIGLMSSLFPSADDIQHGHMEKIGDFLSALTGSSPSKIKLLLKTGQEICREGHIVLVSNMTYVGRHYRVGEANAYRDGLLDVLVFSDLSKMNLLGCALKTDVNELQDHRIEHFHVRKLDIDTTPPMAVMADGNMLGEGKVHLEIQHFNLAVMIGISAQKKI
ncbi:MAG TPA: diacylglycerol kinase family protein [Oscillospiraceae bacterium]|nr:diacylglycerol kinase family protein [Oscillospiraceae bacterium]